jgi:hypothetical protein
VRRSGVSGERGTVLGRPPTLALVVKMVAFMAFDRASACIIVVGRVRTWPKSSSRYSTTVLGQPWVRISGSAPGSGERAWRKWTFCPSMVVVNCG